MKNPCKRKCWNCGNVAHYLELRKQVEAEQTYTISQAIDRIVDGMRLEWEKPPRGSVWRADGLGATYFAANDVWWADGDGVDHECELLEHAKAQCLADYRTRFRAEIEKAVAK